jgi:hypothetical protein
MRLHKDAGHIKCVRLFAGNLAWSQKYKNINLDSTAVLNMRHTGHILNHCLSNYRFGHHH